MAIWIISFLAILLIIGLIINKIDIDKRKSYIARKEYDRRFNIEHYKKYDERVR